MASCDAAYIDLFRALQQGDRRLLERACRRLGISGEQARRAYFWGQEEYLWGQEAYRWGCVSDPQELKLAIASLRIPRSV